MSVLQYRGALCFLEWRNPGRAPMFRRHKGLEEALGFRILSYVYLANLVPCCELRTPMPEPFRTLGERVTLSEQGQAQREGNKEKEDTEYHLVCA